MTDVEKVILELDEYIKYFAYKYSKMTKIPFEDYQQVCRMAVFKKLKDYDEKKVRGEKGLATFFYAWFNDACQVLMAEMSSSLSYSVTIMRKKNKRGEKIVSEMMSLNTVNNDTDKEIEFLESVNSNNDFSTKVYKELAYKDLRYRLDKKFNPSLVDKFFDYTEKLRVKDRTKGVLKIIEYIKSSSELSEIVRFVASN